MSLEKYKKPSLQDKLVNLVKKVEKLVEKPVEKPKKVKIKVEGNNKPQKIKK